MLASWDLLEFDLGGVFGTFLSLNGSLRFRCNSIELVMLLGKV